jgi:3-(3-hydroxy-phenyl)propionate hydroxylase
VGLTAALALARAEVPVLVLEAGAGLSRESRASTFHPPTLEMLDDLGVGEELLRRGLVARTYQMRDRREGRIAEFDLSLLADDTRFPFRLQLEQSQLTEVLLERLRGVEHVEVRFGSPVAAVRQDEGGVTAQVASSGGDEPVRGAWLLAADGAHSAVRRSLQVGFPGLTYPDRYLVLSTPVELRELLPDIAYVNYVGDPVDWHVLLRTPRAWRVLFPVPLEAEDAEVADHAVVQRRLRAVAPRDAPWPVEHATLYKVHQRVADAFRVGRVVLMGDAAHINNPMGGMGMNSGIHDAVFVAREVAAAVLSGGDGGDRVRAVADWRRHVAVEYVGRTTDRNWSQVREGDEEARRRQHAEWRRIAADPEASREFLLRSSMLASVQGAP